MADYNLRLLTSLTDTDYIKINESNGIPMSVFSTNAFTTLNVGSGTITNNGTLTIKGGGNNILSLRDSSNVEKSYVASNGTFVMANGSICADFAASLLRSTTIYIAGQSFVKSPSSGVITFTDQPDTGFNRLQLGGTTSSFPAIKRNGAAIDFRLADDSGYANITANKLTVSGSASAGDIVSLNNDMSFKAGYYFRLIATSDSNSIVLGSDYDGANVFTYVGRRLVVGAASINASAQLQVDSTTKGFLPPRMTNAQMLAIATPAEGLQVYDLTNHKMNYYNGTSWVAILP